MILLTRPYKDSKKLADKLGEENCFIEPMMSIEQLEIDLTEHINNDIQAIVVTSKNVKYFSDIKIPENGSNAREVFEYCLDNLLPEAGKILYLSGSFVTLDIAEKLCQRGYDAERIVTYNQLYPEKFSDEFLKNIEKVKIATFFSNQTIRSFVKLAKENNLNLENITCLCIAKQVAETAKQLNWKDVQIAKTANLNGMLDLINTIE